VPRTLLARASRGEEVRGSARGRLHRPGGRRDVHPRARVALPDHEGGYDPAYMGLLASSSQGPRVPMEPFPQSPEKMTRATETLQRLVLDERLAHGNDPVLNASDGRRRHGADRARRTDLEAEERAQDRLRRGVGDGARSRARRRARARRGLRLLSLDGRRPDGGPGRSSS
jgi:hypothetical protein